MERALIRIDDPTLIDLCNQGIGWVDIFDNMIGIHEFCLEISTDHWSDSV